MLFHRKSPARPGKAPFPTQQLFILALCRICEPIAFMSIFPYSYYMVSSFNVAKDERQIAIYVGMITSAFAFAEFSTGVLWGRMSDKVGRKPILLTGLAGTGLSMLLFGLAPNFPVALFARALGGLLNGNIGVLQTTVAEVVTEEAHQPRAYSIMPFVWCLGSIIGAGLGGVLAQPAHSYPNVFLPGSLFDRYPYLLPNLVCTAVVLVGLVIGILFLEETHEEKKDRRDVGLGVGRWILGKIGARDPEEKIMAKNGYFEETIAFLAEEDTPPAYRSTESSPRLTSSVAAAPEPPADSILSSVNERLDESKSATKAFTTQVILNIVGYGILAFHTISLEQLVPVLLSSHRSTETPSLPFKFVGGFELPTKDIGFILSVQGFLQMIAQIFLFPVVNRRLGSLWTYRLVIFAYPFLYFLAPYLALLPAPLRMPGVYVLLAWKVTAQSLSYPSTNIMLANSAPSTKVLGTLNGAAASSASLCRAFGPTVTGFVHSAGLARGYSGLSWWTCALVAALGALESLFMREEKRRRRPCDVDASAGDEDGVLSSASVVDRSGCAEEGLLVPAGVRKEC